MIFSMENKRKLCGPVQAPPRGREGGHRGEDHGMQTRKRRASLAELARVIATALGRGAVLA